MTVNQSSVTKDFASNIWVTTATGEANQLIKDYLNNQTNSK